MNSTTLSQLFPATSGTFTPGSRNVAREVTWARMLDEGPPKSIKASGSTSASQKAGKRYEARVITKLTISDQSGYWLLHPWLKFGTTISSSRYCQPDLLLFRNHQLFTFEIKLTHTIDAYWQLVHLYRPVLRMAFPDMPMFHIEVTKSFDPAHLWPLPIMLFLSIESLFEHLDTANPSDEIIYVLQLKA